MAVKSSGNNAKVNKLVAENKKLLNENTELKKKLNKSGSNSKGFFTRTWRSAVVVLLVAFVGALLFIGNIFFWAGNTVTDTDKYIQTVTPLIQNSEIQSAITTYATDKIFTSVDVEALTQEVLPPRAEFLAPTLSGQIKNYTNQTIGKIVSSQQFEDVWVEVNTRSHQRLITVATNYEGDGTIDLNDLYTRISNRLEGTKLSFLANKTLPANTGSIVLIQADWLPAFHNLVVNIGLWRNIAVGLLLLSAVVAVWVSLNRRRTVIIIGWVVTIVMLLTMLSIRLTREIVVDKVATQYQAATQEAYQIIFKNLVINSFTLMLVGLLVVIVAWIGGKSSGAQKLRSRSSLLFAGKLHNALFGSKENSLTKWVGKRKRALQAVSVGIVAVMMLTVRLTPSAVVMYSVLMALLIIVIETIASPQKK